MSGPILGAVIALCILCASLAARFFLVFEGVSYFKRIANAGVALGVSLLCLLILETNTYYVFLLPFVAFLTCWPVPILRGLEILTVSTQTYRRFIFILAGSTIGLSIFVVEWQGQDVFSLVWRVAMPIGGGIVALFLLWRSYNNLLVSARILLLAILVLMLGLLVLLWWNGYVATEQGIPLFFDPQLAERSIGAVVSWFVILSIDLGVFFLLMRYACERFFDRSQALRLENKSQTDRLIWSKQMSDLDRQRSLGLLSSSLQHELRQPLAAMHLNTQIFGRQLERHNIFNEAAEQALEQIMNEAHRFRECVERISRFVTTRTRSFAEVNVASEIRETIALIQPELDAGHVRIELTLDQSLALEALAIDLRHMLFHLLINAYESIRNNPEGRDRLIEVRLSGHQHGLAIEVTDSGIGMTPEQESMAGLEPFTTKPSRAGLGLLMVKHFLDQYYGSLSFIKTETNFSVLVVLSSRIDQREPHV